VGALRELSSRGANATKQSSYLFWCVGWMDCFADAPNDGFKWRALNPRISGGCYGVKKARNACFAAYSAAFPIVQKRIMVPRDFTPCELDHLEISKV
jgi:hypothetical protein